MDTESKPNPDVHVTARRHEDTDANAAWIFAIVACLAVLGVGIHFMIAGILGHFKHEPPPADPWTPKKTATLRPSSKSPFPRLQVSPPADLQAFRAREDAELNSYGWIDKTSGVVRVPIERAPDLLLQNPLPVRTGTNGD